ncbi:MAG: Xaa-Pro aminopeptidase [Nitrospirae bacterium RIFCSPHIGHO2_02_FULL_42_12]|nr:MAG: Xaa-Pro aminopeptidase [Nitrospirae bacterium RIFCSPHIGHO2_02_FULL_42_12]
MKIQAANLIIASSEIDSNLYYATKFLAPDPLIFIQTVDEKIMIMSDLEIDRAKDQAKIDTVLSYTIYEETAKGRGIDNPNTADILHEFFQERGIKSLVVPSYFGIRHAILLQEKGYEIEVKKDPFYEERLKKDEKEIDAIITSLRHSEDAMNSAIEFIKDAEIKDSILYSGEKVITSEYIRMSMTKHLLENGLIAQHTIVSCGEDSSSPHTEGSGPVIANVPIIIDLFPRSISTRYYADITRTIVKGTASGEVKGLYTAVSSAQELAISMIRDGIDGKDVHNAILDHFKTLGYESGELNGRMQGFFHGTGHGVGLDVHEPPRINKKSDILHAGNVVTVEPGLYYKGIGGVRLEDIVVVQEDRAINITKYPRILEV